MLVGSHLPITGHLRAVVSNLMTSRLNRRYEDASPRVARARASRRLALVRVRRRLDLLRLHFVKLPFGASQARTDSPAEHAVSELQDH